MHEDLNNIDVDKIVLHWVETSDSDYESMLTLFNARRYNWTLFIGHITIEKLLKAVYVKKKEKHAPFTHNLYRLAELSEISLSSEYSDWLDEITSFNLNARYDDYLKEFYQLSTLEYTEKWVKRIEILREWIKKML
ncbi:MAG: HEPN domain-containing protein [Bacteroidales bacterium]|jgi:HEPN domain-containing protein|nr:HEPN domain-containing protein [Bacteroidales bacterium]